MAANKLNVLHWHLTDAVRLDTAGNPFDIACPTAGQAMSFPLQLASLPWLAEKGSFGPNKIYSQAAAEVSLSSLSKRGAVIQADVRHIVTLAANLSIRVVPEPGSWWVI